MVFPGYHHFPYDRSIFLPGLREVWGFTSLESNLEVGATLGDVGPLDSSFEATRRSNWKVLPIMVLGVYIEVT